MRNERDYVLKLGGHIFIDEERRLRIDLVGKYVDIVADLWNRGIKAHLVVGGGPLARMYIEALKLLGTSKTYQDVLGIEASKLNAKMFAYALRERGVNTTIINNMDLAKRSKDELYVIGGLSPVQSTTAVAALLAEALKVEKLIIATDVEGIFTGDPKKDPNAKLLRKVSLKDVERVLRWNHDPGGYKLLDIVALQVIGRSKIITQIVNGLDPLNVKRAINNEEVGSLIIPETEHHE